MSTTNIQTSKFLSFILRHSPETIGLQLDENGWTSVDALLRAANENGTVITREQLDEVVFTNDKQRFAFSPDGSKIRANQGHSIDIDLALSPIAPPSILFHGTAIRFLARIQAEGLRKMNRQHVHLSSTQSQARRVGARHGQPVVLKIDCDAMVADGMLFYLSANGVWLTDTVPTRFILNL